MKTNVIVFFSIFLTSSHIYAQENDSISNRKKRMAWIEEERLKENTEPIIVRNEKEISLEDYLSMPSDSIEDSYLKHFDDNGTPRSMFYLNTLPEEEIDARGAMMDLPQKEGDFINYDENHLYFIKGGIPPRLAGKADSLKRYVDSQVSIPKKMAKSDMVGAVWMHCYIDEKGHVVRTEMKNIKVRFPIEAELQFFNSADKNPNGWHKTDDYRGTNFFNKFYREQLCFMEEEALRIMNTLPDLEPARCFLKPSRYKLTIPVYFNFKKSWQDNNTAKKHQ